MKKAVGKTGNLRIFSIHSEGTIAVNVKSTQTNDHVLYDSHSHRFKFINQVWNEPSAKGKTVHNLCIRESFPQYSCPFSGRWRMSIAFPDPYIFGWGNRLENYKYRIALWLPLRFWLSCSESVNDESEYEFISHEWFKTLALILPILFGRVGFKACLGDCAQHMLPRFRFSTNPFELLAFYQKL